MSRAYVLAAAWWDADEGPPSAELLPRAERIAAGFSTRILAHVLGQISQRSPVPPHALPWVLGLPDGPYESPLSPPLREIVAPGHCFGLVHAGPAAVAMALFEALGLLTEHEAVLVVFAHDAAPPRFHEPLAAGLLLSRTQAQSSALTLEPPTLHRTPSHFARAKSTHPFAAARALARAACVGSPTVETVHCCDADRGDYWRIELCRAI